MTAREDALNFTEAIKDSPGFRSELQSNERFFEVLQKRLDESFRFIDIVAEHGQTFVSSLYNLTASLNRLWTDLDIRDEETIRAYKFLSDALSQIVNLNKTLLEQCFPKLKVSLEMFSKRDLTKLNDTRNQFNNLSSALSDALSKKAAVNKNKVHELAEAKNSLTAFGTCFAHNSLDYVALIKILHVKKSQIVLESVWYFVEEFRKYFSKGHTFFTYESEFRPAVTHAIDALRDDVKHVERRMQDRHAIVPKDIFQQPFSSVSDQQVIMEGYLFKRSTNAFKTWNRRWFMIRDDKLFYVHKSVDGEKPTVMEDNLKLCLVRQAPPSVERSCCFELVTPSRCHLLQADSETMCYKWIKVLQKTIQYLHENERGCQSSRLSFLDNLGHSPSSVQTNHGFITSPNSTKTHNSTLPTMNLTWSKDDSFIPEQSNVLDNKFQSNSQALSDRSADTKLIRINPSSSDSISVASSSFPSGGTEVVQFLRELLAVPGNDRCADCAAPNPKWASINLGVLVCIECSGAHRSMGVHISKIRSLTMDSLDAEQRNILLQLGNGKVNTIFVENAVSEKDGVQLFIDKHSSRDARESFIRSKYVEKAYVRRGLPDKSNVTLTKVNDMSNYGITHFNSYFSQPLVEEIEDALKRQLTKTDVGPSTDNGRSSNGTNGDLKTQSDLSIVEAIERGDLASVQLAIVCDNFNLNEKIGGTFALHLAVKNHRLTLVEFLMLNDADLNNVDADGNSALHLAASLGHTIEVYQFLKRHANKSLPNRMGETPLSLAISTRHADIVTLLRLYEMREACNDDMNSTMDDVDKFISDLASRQMLNDKDA